MYFGHYRVRLIMRHKYKTKGSPPLLRRDRGISSLQMIIIPRPLRQHPHPPLFRAINESVSALGVESRDVHIVVGAC